MKKLIPILTFALILFLPGRGFGFTETFYVTADGNGTDPENSACVSAGPRTCWDWADFALAGNWNGELADANDGEIGPNDLVVIKDDGGDFNVNIWMNITESGTSGKPITIQAGSGDTPVIDTSTELVNDDLAGSLPWNDVGATWTANVGGVGANVWSMPDMVGSYERTPGRLYLDGAEYPVSDAAANIDATDRWYFNDGTDLLYVYATENPKTMYSSMKGTMVPQTMNINAEAYITIDGLTLKGGYFSNLECDGCTNFILENSTLGDKSIKAILIKGGGAAAEDIIIRNNTIDANYTFVVDHITNSDGIHFQDAVDGAEIYGNTIINTGHCAINISSTTDPITDVNIYDNEMYSPDVDYAHGICVDGTADGGTISDTYNINIYRNSIHDFSVQNQINGANITFTHNLIYSIKNRSTRLGSNDEAWGLDLGPFGGLGPLKNSTIAYNIFYDIDEAGIWMGNAIADMENNVIANNLFIDMGAGSNYATDMTDIAIFIPDDANVLANTWSNNLIYNSGTADVIYNGAENANNYKRTVVEFDGDSGDNCGGSCGAQTISGHTGKNIDPQFINAGADNFSLKSGSPARNGAIYIPGYTTKLRPEVCASFDPANVTTMQDILSIGACGIYRGAAGQ